jgi:hypothetical protein
VFLLFG